MSIQTVPETKVVSHPLDPLTAEEISANREILDRAGLVGPTTRFPLVTLVEPAKVEVLAWREGEAWDRRVRTTLMDRKTGAVSEVLVSLPRKEVLSTREVDVVAEGQPPIMGEEFELVEEILWAHPGWCEAMARRGLTEPRRLRASALSAGSFEIPGEEGRRLVRCHAYLQLDDTDNVWAHPIDGIVAYVDLITHEVVDLLDEGIFELPTARADYEPPNKPQRDTLKPIEITQPEGPSFEVDGNVVRWQNWEFRVGFNQVEGLTLHQIGFRDGERLRPIIYRASVPEMVVPYGDPSPVRFWQNYFDAGEYSMGKSTNSLKLGCDCLGEIHYIDAAIGDDDGKPRTIGNAICMHEEDFSLLWKHTDEYSGKTSTRRQRRLVISFIITVGNYDYGFYWHFYLDGMIELECKATGIVYTSAYPGSDADGAPYPWASEIAHGLAAPFHQHLFSARLDMMVDGVNNAVDEVDAVRVPVGPQNRYGNAFTRKSTRIERESQGMRMADAGVGRSWHVVNPDSRNHMGQPVGYALYPEAGPTLMADPSSSIAKRAAFTTSHLQVTAHHDEEMYPSGQYVNQSSGNAGIDAWMQADRDLDGKDIVVWHTFGLTHFPRPEDWPIMPVDRTGFVMKPFGFFDENPALDVPGSATGHCTQAGEN